MSVAAPTTPAVRPRRPLLTAEPLFAATGLLFALSLLVTLPAMAIDPRTLGGENVWIKPIKFQVALGTYLLTLALFARWLPAGMARHPAYRLFSLAVVLCCVAEIVWIGGAAMFAIPSHFNVSTPFMSTVYGLMGVFAVTLTSATLVYGIAIWRNPQTGLRPAFKLSLVVGLILTFGLTLVVAGALAAQTGHHVGTPAFGFTVPFMGWSREVGDLRVAHFFATHAMHVLPVVGLAARPFAQGVGRGAVVLAAVAFVALVAFTYVQALAGQPFIGAT